MPCVDAVACRWRYRVLMEDPDGTTLQVVALPLARL